MAHLNVLDLRGDVYVDPEDWSTARTKYLDPIPAGGSTSVTWGGQAVNSGGSGSTSPCSTEPDGASAGNGLDDPDGRHCTAEPERGRRRRSQPESRPCLALLTLGVSFSRRRFRRDGGS